MQKNHFLIGTLLVLILPFLIGSYIPISHPVIAQPDTGLRTDITGQYSKPTYGITNFEIPVGWYASEGMFGDNGISIAMHPGTSEELTQKLT